MGIDREPLNRRRHERHRAYIGGRIEQSAPLATMDCLVREISPGGARLSCYNTTGVNDRFTLVLPMKGKRFRAHVVWRAFGEAGVAFEGA